MNEIYNMELKYNGKDIIWHPDKKPHMFIYGESGSGKTTVINSVIDKLINKNINIILANPCEMFISNYNNDDRVFNVSKFDEFVKKLQDIEFKIDLLNYVCNEFNITEIPLDGKVSVDGVPTINGYPLSEKVLDIYQTTHLDNTNEISLDEFNFEDHISEHILIKDKNKDREKKLLITEDNYTTDGCFYFDTTFLIIDNVLYYESELFHRDEIELVQEFERVLKKLLLFGRKYNIHILITSTLDNSKFKELTNLKINLDSN